METNRKVFTKAIKELNDFELAILRERILTVCESTINNKEEIRESMKNGFINPDLFIETLRILSQIISSDLAPKI